MIVLRYLSISFTFFLKISISTTSSTEYMISITPTTVVITRADIIGFSISTTPQIIIKMDVITDNI